MRSSTAAIEAEEPITREIVNYTKEGKRFKQRLTITPLYDADGELQYFAGFPIKVDEEQEDA